MTMFTRGFSFDLAGRVWEIFLSEGSKIVFRVALAILKVLLTISCCAGYDLLIDGIRMCRMLKKNC
jgi:hypothetical protein